MYNKQTMPRKNAVLMAAAVGISLACTTAYAEHARTLRDDTRATQGSHYRNQDLTGGFYEDRIGWAGDWFRGRDRIRDIARAKAQRACEQQQEQALDRAGALQLFHSRCRANSH